MPVKFWQTIVRFWFFLSYLITTVHRLIDGWENRQLLCENVGCSLHRLAFLGSSISIFTKKENLWMRTINNFVIHSFPIKNQDHSMPKCLAWMVVTFYSYILSIAGIIFFFHMDQGLVCPMVFFCKDLSLVVNK